MSVNSITDTRVLVTGAGGFIGSHLSKRLLDLGAEVHAISESGVNARLETLKDKISIHKADICNPKALKETISKVEPDKVYHLAAYTDVGRDASNVDEALRVNVQGTINLLRALESTNYSCFINTGTCEEYGNIPAPFKETQKPEPVSPYSASKTASVVFCSMYCKTYGYPLVNLRPFLTYGPGQGTNRFVPQLISAGLKKENFRMTSGKQTRELNHVSDIVEGFVLASVTEKAIGEIINIGNGIEISVKDIAETINRLMGDPIKIEFGALPDRKNEISRLFCSNDKAKALLGWAPKTELETGLKETIDWYRKHKK